MRARQSDWVPGWVDRFNRLVLDSRCQAALRWMEVNGCDVSLIFELVAGSTHPKADNSAVALAAKKNLKSKLQLIIGFDQQITKMQGTLEALKMEPLLSQSPEITTALPRTLESARNCLDLPRVRKAYDLRKFPGGFAMIGLCLYVRRVTGESAFERIADLLQAGYEAHGKSRVVDPDSLERRVQRFEKDHPTVAKSIDAYLGHQTGYKKG